ncbi:DUF2306 domain-containing protein [Parvularcula sp. LCG005]|uniref:DUF2306 domain-containing protein n=1 Tax=Parvularcula sp. LCG005 TaxID=3078805 RepID=UPI0029429C8D|nr:DUF2306 domain-containing protein [Parvularcula sp. LCG005]WOI53381.1 DUF2306 domain-containing protein [Parvularcula sp. LCG005]
MSKFLSISAAIWYIPVLVGQWIFAAYIIHTYGGSLLSNDLLAWNEHLANAYVPGNHLGNVVVGSHLFLGLIAHLGGPLQLVPSVRKRFPTFHHWNGRIFVVAAILAVFAGLYMLFVRDIGAWAMRLGFLLQSLFILIFAYATLQNAIARRFAVHRRWATRLFLAASAVWFFRVFVMVWFVTTGGVGIDTNTGSGWFLDAMAALQFLPLVGYEVYLRVEASRRNSAKFAASLFLLVAAVAMAVGVTVATLGMWFPNL